MRLRLFVSLAVVFCLFLTVGGSQEQAKMDPGLIAHEWGTFTSIAGARGEAVVWQPQLEKDDLPTFVEHMRNNRLKGGLTGTVRMETPVLYFHATQPATVSVQVSFSDGMLTEWYPHAMSSISSKQLADPIRHAEENSADLVWNTVKIDPRSAPEFPVEHASSRYYAARETSASPLSTKSASGVLQYEKFLFYRGVASFRVPVSAIPMKDGRILVSNLMRDAIPQAILFERRGDKFGYRYLGVVHNASIAEPPELNSDSDSLTRDLERTLVEHGLYSDEAHAMVETWKDSWFEEGSRVLYILPQSFVDAVLPLQIRPAPSSVLRVFVGRMEVVTPTTEKSIETAYEFGDRATISKYGRFLIPILETMRNCSTDESRKRRLNMYLTSAYRDVAPQLSASK